MARARQLARIEQLQAKAVEELGVDPDVLVEEFGPHQLVPHVAAPGEDPDPLPAGIPLLAVHDRDDREVPVGESVRLHAAHGNRSRLVLTSGAGHNAVLGADPTLDAVNAFVARGLAGVDATGLAERAVEEPVPASAGDSVAQG